MKLKNLSIATALLLALTGCGSSGGSNSTDSKPTVKNEKTQQQVSEAKKAEEDRKAEEARLAEETRKAEEARIEKKTKELVTLAKDNGLTDEEAQEFAQNNIDSEDGALKVNLDTFIKVKNLTKRAIAEGLTENEAEAFAKRNVGSSDEQVENNLNKLLINNAKGIYEGQYKDGLSISTDGTSSRSSSSCTNGRCYAIREVLTTGKAIYNQPYSIITADTKSGTRNYSEVNELHNVGINGLKTKVDALPTEGTASYNGKAFDALNQGKLSYQVNFSNKTGSGNITGLGRDITLEQGSISGTSISATATQSYNSGNYTLDFFGKNAEEIGGKVSFDGKDVVGFGGTRGEIQK